MSISVLMRNRDESSYIGFAIQSIIDFIPNAELIVLDNNSTDESLEITSLFMDRLSIKVVNIDTYTPGKALNIGVEKASNETILVQSAHVQLLDLDLELVEEGLQKSLAVFGDQIPIYKGKKITKRYIWSHFGDEPVENMFSDIEGRHFLHNAFCFYKKQSLVNHPFDVTHPGKEDRFWAKDVVDKGESYLYDPRLRAYHFYTKNGATWKGIG